VGSDADPSSGLGTDDFRGPSGPITKATALFARRTIKPTLYGVTQVGRVINWIAPAAVQRTSLAFVDVPAALAQPVRGTECEPVQLSTCKAEWVRPSAVAARSGATVIYFHGSAFIVFGLNSHRPMVSRLARMTGASVLSVGYRMRPTAELEDAIEDGVAAWHHAVESGADPAKIVLAGDSAGGFMAAMLALRLKELGLTLPAGQALMSAATDHRIEPKLAGVEAGGEDIFPRATVEFIYDVYITRNGTELPPPGPADGDLAGLGPFLIQCGSGEMLLGDSTLLAHRLRAAGVRADVQIWDSAIHVFQFMAGIDPDARRALGEVAKFITAVTATNRPRAVPRFAGLSLSR
jgi:acetyl esterase/lipase